MSKIFEVGDRVQIREWDDMRREFGFNSLGDISCTFAFTKDMIHLCGRKATISAIEQIAATGSKRYYLDDWSDTNGCLDWSFSSHMLDEVIKWTNGKIELL